MGTGGFLPILCDKACLLVPMLKIGIQTLSFYNFRGIVRIEQLSAWGNILSTTGSMESSLGLHNPLRYRGYVYDNETGLYYLQSRYYNPSWGRFISADNYPTTGQGLTGNNMFAYCGNNPVSRADEGGEFWNVVAGAVIGAAISAVTQIVTNVVTCQDWYAGVGLAAAAGAISGGLAASGIPIGGQIIGNAIISSIGEGINQYQSYKQDSASFNIGRAVGAVITAGALGAAAGAIGGSGARAPGSAYKFALDNLDNVSAKVASGVYSSAKTSAKMLARANGLVMATAKSTTIITSIRFYAGAKVAQYGMAMYNMFTNGLVG